MIYEFAHLELCSEYVSGNHFDGLPPLPALLALVARLSPYWMRLSARTPARMQQASRYHTLRFWVMSLLYLEA